MQSSLSSSWPVLLEWCWSVGSVRPIFSRLTRPVNLNVSWMKMSCYRGICSFAKVDWQMMKYCFVICQSFSFFFRFCFPNSGVFLFFSFFIVFVVFAFYLFIKCTCFFQTSQIICNSFSFLWCNLLEYGYVPCFYCIVLFCFLLFPFFLLRCTVLSLLIVLQLTK